MIYQLSTNQWNLCGFTFKYLKNNYLDSYCNTCASCLTLTGLYLIYICVCVSYVLCLCLYIYMLVMFYGTFPIKLVRYDKTRIKKWTSSLSV